MKKIVAYPLSFCFYFLFGLVLCFFHPILWVGHKISPNSLDRCVRVLNLFLIRLLLVLGIRVSIEKPSLEKNRPYIIVANHQSTFDIPPILWFLRDLHPKFISKKELGKGIPSVSFNLRYGGSVLIDRKDSIQSIKAIRNFAVATYSKGHSAVIFPEGTRSKNGRAKSFRPSGLKVLLKHMPNALVLPITINHSWKTMQYGSFPMGVCAHIQLKVHAPVVTKDIAVNEVIEAVEKTIKGSIVT